MNIDLEELNKYKSIIGCDEVGRGPIAGPVVGCAVEVSSSNKVTIENLFDLKITDSKKISEKKRQKMLSELNIDVSQLVANRKYSHKVNGSEFSFALVEHSHEVIDKINILQASLSAMKKAAEKLDVEEGKILIDGNKIFETELAIEAVVKGDSKIVVIGLASIIAKEYRDNKMKDLDKLYPGYNLAQHAGYPTKEHRLAVATIGPSPIHRKTFKGVKEFC